MPSPPIEGRNLFDLKKKSYADSYDYNIDVIYPSNHARIDFRRIVPNNHLHRELNIKTSDVTAKIKARSPAGSNALIGFTQRGGREDNLMYRVGEMQKNI